MPCYSNDDAFGLNTQYMYIGIEDLCLKFMWEIYSFQKMCHLSTKYMNSKDFVSYNYKIRIICMQMSLNVIA